RVPVRLASWPQLQVDGALQPAVAPDVVAEVGRLCASYWKTRWRDGRRSPARRVGTARRSASNPRHIAKQALIAAVRNGKSTRLWTRTAAEAIDAARANGAPLPVRHTATTAVPHQRMKANIRMIPATPSSSASST